MNRTALGIVLGLVLCVVSFGCSNTSDAGLSKFYAQKLEWTGCTDFATSKREAEILADPAVECARLDVPLDYADPDGATATVAVSRVAARTESRGSLVFNPGGPGGSGVLSSLAVGRALAASRITEHFDVVSFDPRGVGATEPAVDCYTAGGPTRGDTVFPLLPTNVALTADDTRAVAERCADGSGGPAALAQMGTRTTARDLDVLRAALGEDKLTYLGQSYGTRLGTVYAEQFPQRVRAMVLDGAFDPRLGTTERRLAAYRGFQQAFDAMAAACAAQPGCPLPDRVASFQAIVQPLRDEPVPALDAELDFDDALGGVMAGLYDPKLWPAITRGLAEVRQGRGDVLLGLLRDIEGGDPDAAVNGNVTEALFAINCMDEQRLTPADAVRLRMRTFEVAPFMFPGGDPAEAARGARDGCEAWPAPPTLGIPYAQHVDGLPKTLVVSITGDPTTPHAGAISLAETLGSTLVTVRGEGHTVVSAGTNTCVENVVANYLIDLTLPPTPPTCEGTR